MWKPNALTYALAARDGWNCAYCEVPLAHAPEHFEEVRHPVTGQIDYLHIEGMWLPEKDHVVATSRGGESSFENMVLACGPCNSRKSDMPVEEFLLAFIGEERVA